MKRFLMILAIVALATTMLIPMTVMAKGKPDIEQTNNLSYPVIAVDSFGISTLAATEFTVPYGGEYDGLTPEEIAGLGDEPWYPQKTDGNAWQADFESEDSNVEVTLIDWGDNIESVNPKVRTPFRLEISLYKAVDDPTTVDDPLTEEIENKETMTAYTMAVLENPSSPDELQGTDTKTYESDYASIISHDPKLVLQYLGATTAEIPDDLSWNATTNRWASDGKDLNISPVTFAPELNVAGKYIYGASEGGWKPDNPGYYRITFFIPDGSSILLSENTEFGNFPFSDPGLSTESDEGGVATPVIDSSNNLTYVDVLVFGKGPRP